MPKHLTRPSRPPPRASDFRADQAGGAHFRRLSQSLRRRRRSADASASLAGGEGGEDGGRRDPLCEADDEIWPGLAGRGGGGGESVWHPRLLRRAFSLGLAPRARPSSLAPGPGRSSWTPVAYLVLEAPEAGLWRAGRRGEALGRRRRTRRARTGPEVSEGQGDAARASEGLWRGSKPAPR